MKISFNFRSKLSEDEKIILRNIGLKDKRLFLFYKDKFIKTPSGIFLTEDWNILGNYDLFSYVKLPLLTCIGRGYIITNDGRNYCNLQTDIKKNEYMGTLGIYI